MTRRMLHHGYAALWEIPMWVFLWIGLAIVAAVLLVGPYLEVRQMRWQREYIQMQSARLAQQRDDYQRMLVSLEQNDPVLIQRLAFHYLHLKPKGVQLVGQPDMGRGGVMFTSSGTGIQPRFVAERSATVDQWLYRSMPVIGKDLQPFSTWDTIITRLAAGPQRLLVAVVGGLCILLGLIPLSRLARKPEPLPPQPVVATPSLIPVTVTATPVTSMPMLTTSVSETDLTPQAPMTSSAESTPSNTSSLMPDMSTMLVKPVVVIPAELSKPGGRGVVMLSQEAIPSQATPPKLVQVAAPPPGE